MPVILKQVPDSFSMDDEDSMMRPLVAHNALNASMAGHHLRMRQKHKMKNAESSMPARFLNRSMKVEKKTSWQISRPRMRRKRYTIANIVHCSRTHVHEFICKMH